MTAPAFAPFTPPPATGEGDRYSPKDNIGHVLVIRVDEHLTGVITSNSANGTDAISCQIVDLDDGPAIYRDAMLFGGALVDGLKGYIGQMVVIKLESRQGKSGRSYPVPIAADPNEITRAQAFFNVNPNPFAPDLGTVASPQPQPAWPQNGQQAPAQSSAQQWTPPPPPTPTPPALSSPSPEQVAAMRNIGWTDDQIRATYPGWQG